MSQPQTIKIVFTGGGTGGHIYPIIAIIRQLKKLDKDYHLQVYYIGPKDSFAQKLLAQEGVTVKTTLGGKLRTYFSLKNIVDVLFKIPISLIQVFFYLFIISPDLIFSKGGYGSFPTVLWSMLFQIPLFIHESDISMGRANRFARKHALEIFLSFPLQTREPQQQVMIVGNPVRQTLLNVDQEKGKQFFEMESDRPAIFVLGGSQGARRINNVVVDILPELLSDFDVIHSCGENDFHNLKVGTQIVLTEKQRKHYHLYQFLTEEQLKYAYAASDLIVSRAGSGTLFEIAALGKPSIIIPLPGSARNHQVENAYEFSQNGERTMVIEEDNFTSHFFLKTIQDLFNKSYRLKDMGEQVQGFARPQAAAIIASYINAYFSY